MATTAACPSVPDLVGWCRSGFPETLFNSRGSTIVWTDGPALLDLRVHLARERIEPATLEEAGVELHRALSRSVVAAVALQTLGRVDQHPNPSHDTLHRIAATEIDELLLYAIPPGGPPPLSPQGSTAAPVRWDRARTLAALLPTTEPVDPHRPASWQPVLERFITLACQIDPAALQPRTDPDLQQEPDPAPLVVSHPDLDGPHPLTLTVRFPPWPDLHIVAVTDPHQTPTAPQVEVELRWTDGPAPAQLAAHIAGHGWPRPFLPDLSYRTARSLSPTATAAAVMLYRHLHGEPYRDDAARFHWMARWRSPTVRHIDRRWKFARDRLRSIENQLRTLPLPLHGPLPDPLRSAGDGAELWRTAETLLAVTPRQPPGSLDPTIARASLPVALAATYEELGPDKLTLLHAP